MVKALYLHVPFCRTICSYCDFCRYTYQPTMVDRWLDSIEKEIHAKALNKELATIYIGGGTPTSLSVMQLKRLLIIVQPYTHFVDEYTIESNLEDLSVEKLEILQMFGVNRISIGVQSFDDTLLKIMNRKHQSHEIEKAIELCSSYISNISIDLIYGFQDQSMKQWHYTLQKAISIPQVKHISIYSLTIEDTSVFGKQGYRCVENEVEGEMYDSAISILEKNAFKQYEIANFSREGYQSKHNQVYWHYEDFYGIGFGASGKEEHIRYSNTQGTLQGYCEGVYDRVEEHIDYHDEMFEYIMMNLRLLEGMSCIDFEKRFHISCAIFNEVIAKYEKDICYDGKRIWVTKQGRMHLHDILVILWEVIDDAREKDKK